MCYRLFAFTLATVVGCDEKIETPEGEEDLTVVVQDLLDRVELLEAENASMAEELDASLKWGSIEVPDWGTHLEEGESSHVDLPPGARPAWVLYKEGGEIVRIEPPEGRFDEGCGCIQVVFGGGYGDTVLVEWFE